MGASGQGSCCTTEKPCAEGGGDCDNDNHCAPGLVCGNNNCKYYNADAPSNYDCCEPGYYRTLLILNCYCYLLLVYGMETLMVDGNGMEMESES